MVLINTTEEEMFTGFYTDNIICIFSNHAKRDWLHEHT